MDPRDCVIETYTLDDGGYRRTTRLADQAGELNLGVIEFRFHPEALFPRS